jgi:citrate lyase subunit beta / citryl-CoA lyase
VTDLDEDVLLARRLRGLRSWLFVPGDRVDELLAKAVATRTDALIIDLEDAVAPPRKSIAREATHRALVRERPSQPIVIRINGLATPWWRDDVAMAREASPAAVMLPKTAGPEDIRSVADAFGDDASVSGLPGIVPLVETAAGVLHSEAIAAGPRVLAVALGGEDLAADVGFTRTDSGIELQHARGHLVLACATARRDAIDTPSLDIDHPDRVALDAALARQLGFSGKLAIHPSQVRAINGAFDPTDAEVRWATSILNGLEGSSATGVGAITVAGRMVDKAVANAARLIIERADRARERP